MLYWKDYLWFLAAGVDYEAQTSGATIGLTDLALIRLRAIFFLTVKPIKYGWFLGSVGQYVGEAGPAYCQHL